MPDPSDNLDATVHRASQPPKAALPRRIGRYETIRQIGRGGMGEVWLGRDIELDRSVALKFLIGHDPEDLERFSREAKLAGRLSHPNIAAVYEFGETDGHAFLAMQFIDGVSLSQAGLNVRKKVECLRDAARAVAYAHGQGVIHRDIKPANLMLDRSGRVYVLDFGLARESKPGSQNLTISGTMIGTPSFMAPEQARGHGHVDERSDVWGLGATLYALLAGESPFAAATIADVVSRVLYEEPISIRKRNEHVDGDLATVISKCLEKEILRRYRTAAELADDLDCWLKGEPISARPASFGYRAWKRIHRSPVVAGLITIAIACLIAGGVVALNQVLKRRAAERENTRRLQTLAEIDRVRVRIEDARLMFYRDVGELTFAFDMIKSALADLDRQPDLPEKFFVRGWTMELLGRPKEARREYERAVDGGHVLARVYLARIYAEWALPYWRLFDEDVPVDPKVWFAKARRVLAGVPKSDLPAFELGLYEILRQAADSGIQSLETAKTAQTAFERYPHEEFLILKASVLQSNGRFNEALECLDRAIEMRRGYFEAYFFRGELIRVRFNDPQKSLADFTAAIGIHKDWPPAYARRAMAYMNLSQQDKAIEDCTKAIEYDPTYNAAYGYRGWAHMHLGNAAKADGEAKTALRELEAALEDFETALKVPPNAPGDYRSKASALTALGRHDEAIAAAREGVRLLPADDPLQITLTEAYMAAGRPEEAARVYDEMVQRRPGCRSFRWAFRYRRDDLAGAAEDLRYLVDHFKEDPAELQKWERNLKAIEAKLGPADY